MLGTRTVETSGWRQRPLSPRVCHVLAGSLSPWAGCQSLTHMHCFFRRGAVTFMMIKRFYSLKMSKTTIVDSPCPFSVLVLSPPLSVPLRFGVWSPPVPQPLGPGPRHVIHRPQASCTPANPPFPSPRRWGCHCEEETALFLCFLLPLIVPSSPFCPALGAQLPRRRCSVSRH